MACFDLYQSSFFIINNNIDGLVKSRKTPFFVIPAPHPVRDKLQPESSLFKWLQMVWTPEPAPDPDPGFTGVTTFYEFINIKTNEKFYLEILNSKFYNTM